MDAGWLSRGLLSFLLIIHRANDVRGGGACDSSPCEHGGSCEADVDSFLCVCPFPFEGDRCQQDIRCPVTELTMEDFPFSLPTPCMGRFCTSTHCLWQICGNSSSFIVSFIALDLSPTCGETTVTLGDRSFCGSQPPEDFGLRGLGDSHCFPMAFDSSSTSPATGFTIHVHEATPCAFDGACANDGVCHQLPSGEDRCYCPGDFAGPNCTLGFSAKCGVLDHYGSSGAITLPSGCYGGICEGLLCTFTLCTETDFAAIRVLEYNPTVVGGLDSSCLDFLWTDEGEMCLTDLTAPQVIHATTPNGCAEFSIRASTVVHHRDLSIGFDALYETACSSNPCQNGGTCLASLTGYSCSCPPAFTGSLCQAVPGFPTLPPPAAPTTAEASFVETTEGMVTVGVVCGAWLVLAIVLGYCCHTHSSRSNRVVPLDGYSFSDDGGDFSLDSGPLESNFSFSEVHHPPQHLQRDANTLGITSLSWSDVSNL